MQATILRQLGQGVDGGLLAGVDGTDVFLGLDDAAVAEDAGDGLDVGAVGQQVGAAAVTGALLVGMLMSSVEW